MTTYTDVGLELSKDILDCAQENGADLIITTCPLCQINLEAYQNKINKTFNTDLKIPIQFFSQPLGLALGGKENELGLNRNLIPFQFNTHKTEAAR